MSEAAISVSALRKSYGAVVAVDGIDIEVAEAQIFALLGPNGAGKTTVVEILEGYRTRDSGSVQVLGDDPAKRPRRLRERIGIVLQSTGIEPYLTVEEVLDMYRGYFPRPRRLDDLLELTGLGQVRSKLVNKLSGGQQRRLDVAIGLAGDPDLLFLDEPTTGFDPAARRAAWTMIKDLAALGKTVLLTTHYMEEAEALADRVAIISTGKIVARGSIPELVDSATSAGFATAVDFRLPEGAPKPPKRIVGNVEPDGAHWSVPTNHPTKLVAKLSAWAVDRKIEIVELHARRPSLEDVYLQLTKEPGE